jgi:hypothetical protein
VRVGNVYERLVGLRQLGLNTGAGCGKNGGSRQDGDEDGETEI